MQSIVIEILVSLDRVAQCDYGTLSSAVNFGERGTGHRSSVPIILVKKKQHILIMVDRGFSRWIVDT